MRVLNRLMLIGLSLALWALPAQAQDQGQATIVTPLDGATVSGIVSILGTANHSQLLRYELAFGFSPNPTDTWFSIQDPASTPVVNDVLGRWDTTGISDGVYVLRLRVYWSERQFVETFAQSIKVQNATPAPPPATPAPAATAAPSAIVPSATPVIVLPPSSTPRPTAAAASAGAASRPNATPLGWLDLQTIRGALQDGLMLTGGIFALLGVYAGLKAALRHRPRR